MDRRIINEQPSQPSVNVQHAFQSIAADTVNNNAGIKFGNTSNIGGRLFRELTVAAEYSNTNIETEPGGSKTSHFISGNHVKIEGSVNYNSRLTH